MVGVFRGGGKHNQIISYEKKPSNKKREKKQNFKYHVKDIYLLFL